MPSHESIRSNTQNAGKIGSRPSGGMIEQQHRIGEGLQRAATRLASAGAGSVGGSSMRTDLAGGDPSQISGGDPRAGGHGGQVADFGALADDRNSSITQDVPTRRPAPISIVPMISSLPTTRIGALHLVPRLAPAPIVRPGRWQRLPSR